jgi:predicted ATP-dependent endonuclease of OLD family
MLTSLTIKNFRLFKELSIERLGRVNLVVGKNNSGKSALLEAVELYASNGSITNVLIDLVTNRQEIWKGLSQSEDEAAQINPIRHLFFGHRIPELGREGIILGPVGRESEQLHIFLGAYRHEVNEDNILRRVLVPTDDLPQDPSELELALVARQGNGIRRILRLERDLDFESRTFTRNTLLGGALSKSVVEVVPTRNMTEERLATLWDQINLTEMADEVVVGLQLLDARIEGVAFVEGSLRRNRNARIPIIKLRHLAEPLPLKTMGDGITRIFHIIVALVNARNGVLLVDEFENGLHWSVQPKVWETVFRLAKVLNVQVFATTHSRDCVVGFEHAWNRHQESGAFFRLNAKLDDEITVTPYAYGTLSDALETDVEIR